MNLLKLSLATLTLSLCVFTARAEETQKPDAPKTDEAKTTTPPPADVKPAEVKTADAPPVDKTKTAETTDLPKAPDGTSPVNALHQNESFVGDLSKGASGAKGKDKDKAAKKAAKKGGTTDVLTLHVDAAKGEAKKKGEKKDKDAKNGKDYTVMASGDILTQLKSFAEKHAHVKITGDLSGETITVKEVAEAPVDKAEKKKKKNNA